MAEESPVKPQSEVLFLLGGLSAKMDTVLGNQHGTEKRLSQLEIGLAEVKALQSPRAPWWSVTSGVASFAAVIVVVINLFAK